MTTMNNPTQPNPTQPEKETTKMNDKKNLLNLITDFGLINGTLYYTNKNGDVCSKIGSFYRSYTDNDLIVGRELSNQRIALVTNVQNAIRLELTTK
jgi:hypothetical protein